MGTSYPQMYTPRGHLSTANTITAASSRLDLSETRDFVLDRAAVFSQLDLTKSGTNPPSYSITFAPTLSLTKPSWINAPLNLRHIDVVVLVTCFVTGLTDTAMFANYSTFVSMQTGNTIFIALGAANENAHPFIWVRCLFSLFAYSLGTFAFARFHHQVLAPKTRRLTLLLSYTFQAILTIVAAAIIQAGVVSRYVPSGVATSSREQWDSLAPICLLSLGAGGQIIAARSLGVPDVPTVVVTTMLCELWSDPGLFLKRNAGRNRRALGFLLMLAGAITSGWVDKSANSVQAALWMAATLKLICVGAIALWKGEDDDDRKESST